MTLRDDLERISVRGDAIGAQRVYEGARAAATESLSPIEPANDSARQRSRTVLTILGIAASMALVAAVGIAVLGGSGPDQVTDTAAAPTDSAATSDKLAPEDDPELARRTDPDASSLLSPDRLDVGSEDGDTGWVEAYDPNFGGRDAIPEAIPVYNDEGAQIAWWGFALGWIDLETMDDPNYDYEAAYRDYLVVGEQLQDG